ncbi:hypothetical protein COP2_018684 [Malus domestica]
MHSSSSSMSATRSSQYLINPPSLQPQKPSTSSKALASTISGILKIKLNFPISTSFHLSMMALYFKSRRMLYCYMDEWTDPWLN